MNVIQGKKKNELKTVMFDSIATRKNLIKYLQDEKNIDQIDGKKFTVFNSFFFLFNSISLFSNSIFLFFI